MNSEPRKTSVRSSKLEPEPQIGLVRAVAGDRLVVGETAHRQRHLDPAAAQHVRQQALVQIDHVVDVDEGHLDVQLREVRLPVRAQVLVTEAARDLKIPLEAADHQQLLEELRRLGQRVEGAPLQPARHEEVAGALGRRAGEHRRLDLHEALPREELPHRRGDPVAQLDRLPHAIAPEVEIAIAQAGLLAHLAGEGLDLEGGRLGVREQLGAPDPDLDLPGGQVGIDRLGRALHHPALGAEHVLGAQLVPQLEGLPRLVRVEDQLHQPGPVAQVDEDEAAVVAPAMDPARDAHLRVDPVREDLPAPGVAVVVRAKRWEAVAHGDGVFQ